MRNRQKHRLLRTIHVSLAELGLEATQNFLKVDPKINAYTSIYSCGEFELPHTYQGLVWHQIDDPNLLKFFYDNDQCFSVEGRDYFIHSVEAVAKIGGTALTRKLLTSSNVRFIEVVCHEEFHDQPGWLPPCIEETAASVFGLYAAKVIAEKKIGEESIELKELQNKIKHYLWYSHRINRLYSAIEMLCRKVQDGTLSLEQARKKKIKFFYAFQAKLPSLPLNLNNTWLVQTVTYEHHYPLLHTFFETKGLEEATRILLELKAKSQYTDAEDVILAQLQQLIET